MMTPMLEMIRNGNRSATGTAWLLAAAATACSGSDGASTHDGGQSSVDGASIVVGAVEGGSQAEAGPTTEGGAIDGASSVMTLPVDLRSAGTYAILAESGIATIPTSAVTGNVAVSPAAATYLTGFALTADITNVFSTSPQVTGQVFASDYAPPTPSALTAAIGDMKLAFSDAAGRAPTVTQLGAGNVGGRTLAPGVYEWSTDLLVPTPITLAGTATDVWIFQIAQNLTFSSAATVVLTGGALAKNVFWQVGAAVTLGTTSHCEGILLAQASVTLQTGASITGRLLAQTAVNIDASTVVEPSP